MQAAKCYEVIRRHGKKIVIMEAIKGGGLSALPEDAEALLKALRQDGSSRHVPAYAGTKTHPRL